VDLEVFQLHREYDFKGSHEAQRESQTLSGIPLDMVLALMSKDTDMVNIGQSVFYWN